MTPEQPDSVERLIADMRAEDKPAHYRWGHYADRIEKLCEGPYGYERINALKDEIARLRAVCRDVADVIDSKLCTVNETVECVRKLRDAAEGKA